MRISTLSIFLELISPYWINRIRFCQKYWRFLLAFVKNYHGSYKIYSRKFSGDHDDREATVRLLLLNAFNNILVSTNLLMQSMWVPSGNLMRNFSESVSAAILFSCNKLPHFDEYQKNKRKYKFYRLVNDLNDSKIQRILSLDKKGTSKALEIHQFYHLWSHTTAFSLSVLFNIARNSRTYLGPLFDAKRSHAYEIELKRRISACVLLENVIELTHEQLRKRFASASGI